MMEFLDEQTGEVEEYDEQIVRRLIEKLTVFEGKLMVKFKSGLIVEIE